MASDFAPGFTFEGFGGGEDEAQAPWEFGGENCTSFHAFERAPQHATPACCSLQLLGSSRMLNKALKLHAVKRCRS